MSAKGKTKAKEKAQPPLHINPYFTFLLFAGLGLGMWPVESQTRITVLWLVLLGISLLQAAQSPITLDFSLANLGQGALVGLIVALPFVVLAPDFLRATATRLYASSDGLILFQRLVLIAAPIEELYFRGYLQREQNLVVTAILYGAAGLVYFLPGSTAFVAILLSVVVGMVLLGFVYGYVCQRYGLTASIACHAVVNFGLLVLPLILTRLTQVLEQG